MIPVEESVRNPGWSQGEPIVMAGQTWYLPKYDDHRDWFTLLEHEDRAGVAMALASGDPGLITQAVGRRVVIALLTNYRLYPDQIAELLPLVDGDTMRALGEKLEKSIAEGGPVIDALERNRKLGDR